MYALQIMSPWYINVCFIIFDFHSAYFIYGVLKIVSVLDYTLLNDRIIKELYSTWKEEAIASNLRYWRKSQKYIKTANVLAEIQTRYLPNRSQKCYCMSQLAQLQTMENTVTKTAQLHIRIHKYISPVSHFLGEPTHKHVWKQSDKENI